MGPFLYRAQPPVMACVLCGGRTAVPVAINGYGAVPKPQDGHNSSVVKRLPFPETSTVPEPYQPLMKCISSVTASTFWDVLLNLLVIINGHFCCICLSAVAELNQIQCRSHLSAYILNLDKNKMQRSEDEEISQHSS